MKFGHHSEVACDVASCHQHPLHAGPRSSAVVGGHTHLHRALERGLAQLKGTEECMLCPTGFAANMAVITALCSDAEAAVFSDELNHASIIDGARLAARDKASARLPW